MSQQRMVESVTQALSQLAVDGPVLAVGQFLPRGHTGSMFAGSFLGDGLGGGGGGLVDSIATVGGSIAGYKIHDAASGLPERMLICVTATAVYGFAAPSRASEAGPLVFALHRDDLTVQVHQRVNVRILELIQSSTGAKIQVEGNRLPLTHSKDVIDALT